MFSLSIPRDVFLIGLLFSVPVVQAGRIHKCTQADGSVTFSDTGCPESAADREYRGESVRPPSADVAPTNPYSVMEQVRRIEQRGRAERLGTTVLQSAPAVTNYQRGPASGAILTFEAARRRALEATGYRNYEQLTGPQQRRVNAEMAKYKHLPPQPVETPPPPTQAEIDAQRILREQREKQEQAREVERTYEWEKRWHELGVYGRAGRYKDAVEDCKNTFEAHCR